MPRPISKDTTLCISLSARPGNFGTRLQNFLYEALDLDALYKAVRTTDLAGAITGIRALGIRGAAVSMPFKEACIPLLDELDPAAADIGSVNTIVNTGGRLRGYNTDYIAVRRLLEQHRIPRAARFAVRGSGGMARAVLCALGDVGFQSGVVIARNRTAGRALAQGRGLQWQADTRDLAADLLINATPIGMSSGMTGDPEATALAFETELITAATTVFDVVALPPETPLIRTARALGKQVITGAEVIAIQALEQFVLYTGQHPTPEQVRAAIVYAGEEPDRTAAGTA